MRSFLLFLVCSTLCIACKNEHSPAEKAPKETPATKPTAAAPAAKSTKGSLVHRSTKYKYSIDFGDFIPGCLSQPLGYYGKTNCKAMGEHEETTDNPGLQLIGGQIKEGEDVIQLMGIVAGFPGTPINQQTLDMHSSPSDLMSVPKELVHRELRVCTHGKQAGWISMRKMLPGAKPDILDREQFVEYSGWFYGQSFSYQFRVISTKSMAKRAEEVFERLITTLKIDDPIGFDDTVKNVVTCY